MMDASTAAVLVAIIGGAFGVWSAYVSSKSQKATKKITSVLANTKGPVDSLDQVIKVLQDEITQTNQRREEERKYFEQELTRLRAENEADRKAWEAAEFKMQATVDKLVDERISLLDQIRDLKVQLGDLEAKVRNTLGEDIAHNTHH